MSFNKEDKVMFNMGRGSFVGTVEGTNPNGQIIVRTKDGKILIRSPDKVKRAFNDNK